MSTQVKNKNDETKEAEPHIAHKLANQVDTHLRNIESQVVTPKKREFGASSSVAKDIVGILRGLQPRKTTAQKARISKNTSEISI